MTSTFCVFQTEPLGARPRGTGGIKHLTAGNQGLSHVPAAAQGDSGMATE